MNVNTTLGGGTTIVQGLFIEMFLTAELVFVIFMLAAEKHKATYLAPVGIGLALFVSELTGVYFTGGSLNPARSFGPAAVTHNFPGYHCESFIPVVGGPALITIRDLLARAYTWFSPRRGILQTDEVLRIRDCEPWTRFR